MKLTQESFEKIVFSELKNLMLEKGDDSAYPGDLGISTGLGDDIDDLAEDDDSEKVTGLDAEIQVAQGDAESYTGAQASSSKASSAAAAKRVENMKAIDFS